MAKKTSFQLPEVTIARLRQLSEHRAGDRRPSMADTLIGLVEEAHRAAGLPEPQVPAEPGKAGT